jgi:mono/diheme cytochrome c family protein
VSDGVRIGWKEIWKEKEMRVRRPPFLVRRWLLIAALAVAGTPAWAQESNGQTTKIWSGVYAAGQAERGKARFTGLCRRCHNDDLNGSERGPALRGENFISNWEAQDLSRLLSKIRDSMPPDDPGSLADDEYLSLVSYILQANAFPAGTEELSADALSGIRIMRKPGEGPSELRNFSLVQVVGCLTQGPDGVWTLTNTSEPFLAKEQPSTAEELKAAGALPVGVHTFRLISVAAFSPESHKGHRMEAKGLLYKASNKDRLNVSSLQMVAAGCAN